ncbi:uncharacterized protein FIBRA_05704 [Fibroporia radiculosa]|uniref:Uncharacterized protein n=1 Tax=Fibroporia radiculosa TaxID=599839 RepID=J4G9Y8_9APHY|nr:uncharacterized protein FIBRA_05704 [Fibroporia radiculosa]CCM03568.1 predicted protein [Fibroporia radiculosa]
MSGVAPRAEQRSDKSRSSVDSNYLSHFSEYLSHVRSHLAGKDGSGPLSPSVFAPCAYWTCEDKEAFFHGLSVHSRFRPDLIAEEVKTKSATDVCVYLDLLERGAQEAAGVKRKDLPAAMEVSNDWIALEEQKALEIASIEPELDEKIVQDARAEEIRVRKLTTRAKRGDGRIADERDREGERKRKKELNIWLKDKQEEWEVEDLLRELDVPTLKAMNVILREGNEVCAGDGQGEDDVAMNTSERLNSQAAQGESTVGMSTSSPPEDDVIDPLLRAQSQQPSTTTIIPGTFTSAISGESCLAPAPSYTLPQLVFQPRTPPFSTTVLLAEDAPSADISLAQGSRPLTPAKVDDVVASSTELQLSPAARRRLQKRLHMRKKRAAAKGLDVDRTLEKLKPGRRRKGGVHRVEERTIASVGQNASHSTSIAIDKAEEERPAKGPGDSAEEAEVDNGNSQRHPHPSGVTLPYRLHAQLQTRGIDAEKLQNEGLSLFNLASLARLMQLYNRLHDVPASIASHISTDLIRLLYAHVAHFTAQLMHRAITLREQERRAKMHTKAWRMGRNGDMVSSTIHHALAMMCSDEVSKKAHFEKLLHKLGFNEDNVQVEPSERQGDEEDYGQDQVGSEIPTLQDDRRVFDDNNDDTDGGTEEEDSLESDTSEPLPEFPLHRTIYAPSIRLPSYTQPGATGQLQATLDASFYAPWPSQSASSEPIADDDIMSDATDTDALLVELLEEEELDQLDETMKTLYEKSLWAKFQLSRQGQGMSEDDNGHAQDPLYDDERSQRKRKRGADDKEGGTVALGLRFRKPDPNGPVKSQIYVVDSD